MGKIHDKYFIRDYINAYRNQLVAAVDKLDITNFTNVSKITNDLLSTFTIKPLLLKEPIPSEPFESPEKRQNEWGKVYNKKYYNIKVEIPLEGDSILFDCYPSESTIVIISERVTINKENINALIVLEELNADKYQKEIELLVKKLSSNIPRINLEISPWNEGLETLIGELIDKRRGQISQKHAFMEKIGLKVNPKSSNYMIPSPIVKKHVPTVVSETTKNVKTDFIPILQDEVYKDIKEVIYNVGRSIERKPSLYKNKQEEDLRDIFLLFLETRYDSTTGIGEAFNKKGRTDILLKFAPDGSNIFVAECKFWKGQSSFKEAIDQLLGYLTHRDSKTALMVFANQKDSTAIVQTIKSEIGSHKQYKRFIKNTYESSMSYEFFLPSDSQKIIQIEVMVFHFP